MAVVVKSTVYPQLPAVTDDPKSLKAWVDAATQILRTLTGDVGTTGYASMIIVTRQGNATESVPTGIKDGDLWVAMPTRAGQVLARSIWLDGAWVPLNGSW